MGRAKPSRTVGNSFGTPDGIASTEAWDQSYISFTRPRLNTSFVWHKAQTPSNYYYYYHYYDYYYSCYYYYYYYY